MNSGFGLWGGKLIAKLMDVNYSNLAENELSLEAR